MSAAKVRLAVTAALFLAWIGWLGYLAATTTRPEVLSRPQFLVSNLYVIADLTGSADRPGALITVKEVGGSAKDNATIKPGSSLEVENLPRVNQGWAGPDSYILPLSRNQDGTFRLTPVPPSPGYPSESSSEHADRLRIYRATDRTLQQLREMQE
jgi:hypothetical protein